MYDGLNIMQEVLRRGHAIHIQGFVAGPSGLEPWIRYFHRLYVGVSAMSMSVGHRQATGQALRTVGLNKLLLESHAPYDSPSGYPEGANHPWLLGEVARALATVCGWDLKEVCQVTADNARALYQLQRQ